MEREEMLGSERPVVSDFWLHQLLICGCDIWPLKTSVFLFVKWAFLQEFPPNLVYPLVQSFSRVWLFVTPWTAAHKASQFITNSQRLLKLMSIESVMPYNHLILCRPLLLLPSIFPSIRVFSNKSVLPNRWPEYWSFSFSISPSCE